MTISAPVSPANVSTIAEVLLYRASNTPDALAFHVRETSLTWSLLLDGALRAASAFRERGLRPGDFCAVVLPTSQEFLFAFLGAQLIGAVPVAINPNFPPAQVRRRVNEIGCGITVVAASVLASPAGIEAFTGVSTIEPAALTASRALPRAAAAPSGPDDLAHLQLTSGTTGSSRAVMLRHRNVMAAMANAVEYLEPTVDDVFVGWLPLYHDLGLIRFVMESAYFGCPTYLIPASMPTLPTWFETMSRVRGTITAAPDFAYRLAMRLVQPSRVDLRSLRIATNGGEVVRMSTISAFETAFDVPGCIRPGYGLAEATLGVAMSKVGEARRVDASGTVSCGHARIDVRIADADGRSLPPGTRGRILARGESIFAGYLHDPAGTAEVLRDGWLDTGDDGTIDADGHVYIHGRRRAMIKRGGATIAPREIEEVVDELDGVRRSAAVGIVGESESATEEVVVVAEIERNIDEDTRLAIRRRVISGVRDAVGFLPHDVVFVAPGEIPRTPTGKIQYDQLKRTYAPTGAATDRSRRTESA